MPDFPDEATLAQAAEFAKNGDEDGLRLLSDRGTSLCPHEGDRSTSTNLNPLIVAAGEGHLGCLRIIIGTLTHRQADKFFPMGKYAAIRNGKIDSWRILHSLGNTRRPDDIRKTFEAAIDSDDMGILEMICQRENPRGCDSWALHYSVLERKYESISFLAPISDCTFVIEELLAGVHDDIDGFALLLDHVMENHIDMDGGEILRAFYEGDGERIEELYKSYPFRTKRLAGAIAAYRNHNGLFSEHRETILADDEIVDVILNTATFLNRSEIVEEICESIDFPITPNPVINFFRCRARGENTDTRVLINLLRHCDTDDVALALRLDGHENFEGMLSDMKAAGRLIDGYVPEGKTKPKTSGGL